MDINRHSPRLIPNNCQHINPPYFSLPTIPLKLLHLVSGFWPVVWCVVWGALVNFPHSSLLYSQLYSSILVNKNNKQNRKQIFALTILPVFVLFPNQICFFYSSGPSQRFLLLSFQTQNCLQKNFLKENLLYFQYCKEGHLKIEHCSE